MIGEQSHRRVSPRQFGQTHTPARTTLVLAAEDQNPTRRIEEQLIRLKEGILPRNEVTASAEQPVRLPQSNLQRKTQPLLRLLHLIDGEPISRGQRGGPGCCELSNEIPGTRSAWATAGQCLSHIEPVIHPADPTQPS
ncbi:hypothetical protein J7E97_34120 [Streptomyces sp. ISL-66]|uniref:hypothetical protein n=1 Tax=Streptomyces sp. ISL-66 TaxID=2819186 RepID=UPI001BE4E33D|nr:hypothetical protein [Streptomyces sp. ISL-66]MBT2472754.1 hypothetical protein [Streptomyces sp. ISL-66]